MAAIQQGKKLRKSGAGGGKKPARKPTPKMDMFAQIRQGGQKLRKAKDRPARKAAPKKMDLFAQIRAKSKDGLKHVDIEEVENRPAPKSAAAGGIMGALVAAITVNRKAIGAGSESDSGDDSGWDSDD